MQVKTCTKCGIEKEVSEYHKKSSGKYGVRSVCKECRRGYNDIIYQMEYRKLPKRKTQKRKYYINHQEDLIQQAKTYRIEHPEIYKKYYIKNKTKLSKKYTIWVQNNPQKRREIDRRRRERKQRLDNNYTVCDEQYTRGLFNNQCVNCGSTEKLCIDHHYPLSKGYPLTRENGVVLCHSCNSSKRDKLPEQFYSPEQFQFIEEKLGIQSRSS